MARRRFCSTMLVSETVRKAVEICSRHSRRIPLECAGGINLENVRAYAETGVDFISVGALTHSSDGGGYEYAGGCRLRGVVVGR